MATDNQGDRQVTAAAELRALSHPLRVQLLAALRAHGPATSAELARRFDTDTGSTSYHLRQLAKFGFVTDGEPSSDQRERRWAAVHATTSWSNTAMAASGEGREAVSVMRRHQVEVLIRAVRDFEAHADDLSPEWVEASGIGDLLVRLTPGSLTELWDTFYAHVDALVARDADDPAALPVSVVAAGFPRVGDH
ncbi:helix-turn-helix domain-containing protein [Longispora urticae]